MYLPILVIFLYIFLRLDELKRRLVQITASNLKLRFFLRYSALDKPLLVISDCGADHWLRKNFKCGCVLVLNQEVPD